MALKYGELRLVVLENPIEPPGGIPEINYTLASEPFYRNLWGNSLNNELVGNAFDNVLNGEGEPILWLAAPATTSTGSTSRLTRSLNWRAKVSRRFGRASAIRFEQTLKT
jgi:hypothetical protein